MKTIEFEMPVLDLDATHISEQMDKVREEFKEWNNVFVGDNAEDFAESFDLIQSTTGYIGKIGTLEEIKAAAEQHYKKLMGRGWKTKGRIRVVVEVEENG